VSASTATTAAATGGVVRGRLRLRRPARGLGLSGWIAAGVLVFVFLLAAVGPLLTSTDPNAVNLAQAYGAPSAHHLLAQDANGRDLLTRLIFGARTALVGPLLVVLASTLLGTALALAAVWFGGWLDAAVARVIDAVFAFPGLLLAILATSLFGAGLPAAVVALSISYTPYMARIVRSAALRERAMPYVAALRVQGLRGVTICLRHILPNIVTLITANATLSFGFALIDLAALSFIGLGVQAPTADWGAMVGAGVPGIMQHYPQESVYASVLIVATVAAANLLGDRLSARSEARS
jgi:peptide/nickel transport system permease protein